MVVIAEFRKRISAALHLTIRTNRASAVSTFSHGMFTARRSYVAVTGYVLDLARGIHAAAMGFVRENQDELNGQCLLPLSCHPLWSGCGVSFTARSNVGWLSFSASASSDTRGAAIRKASTSFFSLDT